MKRMTAFAAMALALSLLGVSAAEESKAAIEGCEASLTIDPAFVKVGSFEVMLGFAFCSANSITLEFRASGNSLEGLAPRQTSMGNIVPYLSVPLTDCDNTLDEIRLLLAHRQCSIAPPYYGTGISFLCDGDRNQVVRTVAEVVRTAFDSAAGP